MIIPDVVWLYLGCILAAVLTSVVCALSFQFGLWRTCRRLAIRIQDLEGRALSVQGKTAAKARWDPEQWIAEGKNTPVVTAKKREYDNDPLT
jgi:hypothetical protein